MSEFRYAILSPNPIQKVILMLRIEREPPRWLVYVALLPFAVVGGVYFLPAWWDFVCVSWFTGVGSWWAGVRVVNRTQEGYFLSNGETFPFPSDIEFVAFIGFALISGAGLYLYSRVVETIRPSLGRRIRFCDDANASESRSGHPSEDESNA